MNSDLDAQTLTPTFENPELGSEQTFRAIIEVMVRPGQLVKVNRHIFIPDLVNMA